MSVPTNCAIQPLHHTRDQEGSSSQTRHRGTKQKKTAQGGKGMKLVPSRTPDATAGQTKDRMRDVFQTSGRSAGARGAAPMVSENPPRKASSRPERQKGPTPLANWSVTPRVQQS